MSTQTLGIIASEFISITASKLNNNMIVFANSTIGSGQTQFSFIDLSQNFVVQTMNFSQTINAPVFFVGSISL
jgi:hypothetical protein